MTKPHVLLDMDGVVVDFLASALRVVEEVTGVRHRVEDLPTWEIFDHIGREHEDLCYERFREEGFCASMLPYAGAVEGVERLCSVADIRVVTSPIHGRHWYFERVEWARRHLGIAPGLVCFTKQKHIVHGDVLIDDRVNHVEDWCDAHPAGIGIVWDQPYNRSELPRSAVGNARRARSWDEVIAAVKRVGERRRPITLDEHLLSLIGRAVPLGLTEAEILLSTPKAFGVDVGPALVRFSRETPPRLAIVDGRWKLAAPPAPKSRSPLLGSGRDPGPALGFGGGPAMVVSPRGRRS